ncbi:MAG: trypsin-like peptidase domain-containing protein [Isosphaeraceae bacterium]
MFVPWLLACPAVADDPAGVQDSVVKIFATMRGPDLVRPWTKSSPREGSGTGIILEGKRILTNAHVVAYATQVMVQAQGSGDKIAAEVVAFAPGIDLAVLKLEDEAFFEAHPPLPRAAQLPQVKDAVLVYGYPTGGTSLSITKGIVSRIEFASYGAQTDGLRIQIDAAINPGNSGGPALVDDKMIGLAFSRLGTADNIGYIIPTEEVELFLQDVADGTYDGKPRMFDQLQTLENDALRARLKLDRSAKGVVVTEPSTAVADSPLKKWDVISKIGDREIDNDAQVRLESGLRVRFPYLIQHVAREGKVPLTIIRDGKTQVVEMPVANRQAMLIEELLGTYPSYFIYGPLVFAPASAELVGILSRSPAMAEAFGAIGSPLITRRGDRPRFEGEQLVVVTSPMFPHKIAKGYSNPLAKVVKEINGVRIKNLAHLVEVLRDLKDEFVVIDFDDRASETLVFARKEIVAATDDILTDNGVRRPFSDDMGKIWDRKDP